MHMNFQSEEIFQLRTSFPHLLKRPVQGLFKGTKWAQFPHFQGPPTAWFETWIKVNYSSNTANFSNEDYQALQELSDDN